MAVALWQIDFLSWLSYETEQPQSTVTTPTSSRTSDVPSSVWTRRLFPLLFHPGSAELLGNLPTAFAEIRLTPLLPTQFPTLFYLCFWTSVLIRDVIGRCFDNADTLNKSRWPDCHHNTLRTCRG